MEPLTKRNTLLPAAAVLGEGTALAQGFALQIKRERATGAGVICDANIQAA